MKITSLVSAIFGLLFVSFPASAIVVAQGGTGSAGAGGFSLSGGSGVIVDVSPHPAWTMAATSPASFWVWDSDNTSGQAMTFSFSFSLVGFDPTTAVVSILWAVDNFGDVRLNNSSPIHTIPFDGNAYATLHSHNAGPNSPSILPGVNTLDFVVADAGLPGGFRASVEVTADPIEAPAPGTMVLLIGGAGFAAARLAKSRMTLGQSVR